MKIYIWRGLFMVGLLLIGLCLQAQQQMRFSAGILAGVNAAQVQGDDAAGFNKLGLRGGVRGIVRFSDRAELSMDIMYSQRGSTNGSSLNNSFLRWVVSTNYIEVPVLFTFKDWYYDNEYYRIHFQGGLSYSRLFQTRITDKPGIEVVQENFTVNDIGVAVGAGFFLSKNLGIYVRYNRSIVPLYDRNKFLDMNVTPVYKLPLWGYHLSFELAYIFN